MSDEKRGLLGPGGGPLMLSRRLWLTVQALRNTSVSWSEAQEAVATTAIEHPEWDMTETKTWFEWEQTERNIE